MSENVTESFSHSSHSTNVPLARGTICDCDVRHGLQVVEKFGLIQAVFAHGELERGGAGRIPPVSGRTCSKRCHERSTLMKFQVEKKLFFKRPP